MASQAIVWPTGTKGFRRCSRCEFVLPIGRFERRQDQAGRYRAHCRDCRQEYAKKWRSTEHGKLVSRIQSRKYHPLLAARMRLKVLDHYGHACACCGESNERFLTVDHIAGCGKELRKQQGSGTKLYKWLVRNKMPHGYRILCFNCNCSRRGDSLCPEGSHTN